jgi:serine/threonine protein phosphatase 1
MKFVIGDVHGCVFTLEQLLARIRSIDARPQLFFVGDYLDRGKNSRQTLDKIIELQSQGAVCVRGNHDDVLDYIVNGQSMSKPSEWVTIPPTMEKIISWWIQHGLTETYESYGFIMPPTVWGPYGARVSGPNSEQVVNDLKREMPEAHKQFLRSLKLYHEEDDFFILHGFFKPHESLPRDFKFLKLDPNECMWGRFSGAMTLAGYKTAWDKRGVFGHTPTSVYGSNLPIIADKIRLVDTCVFSGKLLSAWCVEKDNFLWVETDERDLAKRWR